MKKLITLCITCSLALAAGALAQQQDDTSPAPRKKQHEKAREAEQAKPQPGEAHAAQPAARPHPGRKAKEAADAEKAPAATPAAEAAPAKNNAKAQMKKGRKEHNAAAEASATPATPAKSAKAPAKPAATSTPNVAAQSQPANTPNPEVKKPDVKVVQRIKAQHANFKAQPKPEQVPAVTFSKSRTITDSQHWQGPRYSAFRSYHPERHDQSYYHSHYSRVELIGGGYYYFNNGYWYPAWGYQPTAQYYVYDGPIYAGRRAEPPDRVIADVQAELQDLGYYKGEVDGLLGPLTRDALRGYQGDHSLYTTAAIDEPTLSSLGMD